MGDLIMMFFSNPFYIAFCVIVSIIAIIVAIIDFRDDSIGKGIAVLVCTAIILILIPVLFWILVGAAMLGILAAIIVSDKLND